MFGASADTDQCGFRLPTLPSSQMHESAIEVTPELSVGSSDLNTEDYLASTPSQTTVTTCPLCPDKSYSGTYQRRNYRRHFQSKHGGAPKIQCPIEGCDISFPAGRGDNFQRHMRLQHPDVESPYSCVLGKRRASCHMSDPASSISEPSRKSLRAAST